MFRHLPLLGTASEFGSVQVLEAACFLCFLRRRLAAHPVQAAPPPPTLPRRRLGIGWLHSARDIVAVSFRFNLTVAAMMGSENGCNDTQETLI